MFRAMSAWLLCSVGFTAAPELFAQTVYRCGNSYSQAPCPGGAAIDVTDKSSREKRARAKAVIERDKRTADTMEAQRLKQEAALTRSSPETAARPASQAKKPRQTERKPPAKSPYFTARAASGDKKSVQKKAKSAKSTPTDK